MESQPKLELSEEVKHVSKVVAMIVRNALEDFHNKHLSDEQMRQLNPIIRNAICTGIHANQHYTRSDAAKKFVEYHWSMIPEYWEEPELQADYVKLWDQ